MPVRELPPMDSLTNLLRLSLEGLDISNSDIAKIKIAGCKDISLADCGISDVRPLQKLPKLRTLDVSGTEISSFEQLSSFSITSLNVSRTALDDLSDLPTCVQELNVGINKSENARTSRVAS